MTDSLITRKKLEDTLVNKIGDRNAAEDLAEKVINICSQFYLPMDEVGEVLELVNKVVLGEIHREQFFDNLQKVVNIEAIIVSEEDIRKIFTLIDDEIFSQIKKYSGQSKRRAEEEKIAGVRKNLEDSVSYETKATPAQTPASRSQSDDVVPEKTRKEIEELKEKLSRLENRSGEYSPAYRPESQIQIPIEPKKPEPQTQKRYGVEPAKDLGAADFDWQGNVGGVEIEQVPKDESQDNEETLDKAQILEEVEHPPVYRSPSPLEEKLTSFSNTEPKNEPVEEKRAAPAPKQESIGNPESEEEVSLEDLEMKRQETYKSGDPYREPVE